MQEQLQAAIDEYNSLITELSASSRIASSGRRKLAILRNCYFGRADALFDLGRLRRGDPGLFGGDQPLSARSGIAGSLRADRQLLPAAGAR